MHSTADNRDNDKDSIRNTIKVALTVSLVCSILVSSTAVLLKPRQTENRLYYSGHRNIIQLIETMQLGISTDQALQQLEVKLIDLDTGEIFDGIDPDQYDQREAVNENELSINIPRELDIANIAKRARYAKVYLLRQGGRINYFLLPVHGGGMWSTLYGYLALESDANTIAGISIYEQAETPGLGDKIEDLEWLAQWKGKSVYQDGIVSFQVVKRIDPALANFQVDAIAGATISSESMGRMIQYWLGTHAYQPFLERIRREIALGLTLAQSSAAQEPPPAEPLVINAQSGASSCLLCHNNPSVNPILNTPHVQQGCESCHGPSLDHISGMGANGKRPAPNIIFGIRSGTYPVTEFSEQNQVCLGCHNNTNQQSWHGSQGQFANMACASCHNPHTRP